MDLKNAAAASFATLVFMLGAAACGPGTDASAESTPAAPPSPSPGPSPSPSPTPSPPGPSPTPTPPPDTAACPLANGRVLTVGPTRQYATPSQAAAVAQSGDTIHIDAGDYRGDVATWYASNLTICGINGRARLFADGRHAQGKGIWVISTPNSSTTTILNVEFHRAKVPDQNGAGIRLDGGNLVLRNTGFFDNENGILGGVRGTTVTIQNSEFARNGFGDGYTHNIYIGQVDRLTVVASFFHEAKIGHNLKSRAKENYIENSYFMDGPTGTASYLLDFPNGGVVFLRGNLLQKGPRADNSISISYGAEGIQWITNTLDLVHNTLVSTRSGGTFVYAAAATQRVSLRGNVFAGNATSLISGFPSSNVAQQSNVATSAASFPGADLVSAPNFWPSANLQAQLAVGGILDPAYIHDAPRPLALRTITGQMRMIGALQTPP